MTAGHTYSVGEIASLLDVSPGTVRLWIDRGRLPGFRLPGDGHRRVAHEDLMKFARENGFQNLQSLQSLMS